jgi:hypothetical protein
VVPNATSVPRRGVAYHNPGHSFRQVPVEERISRPCLRRPDSLQVCQNLDRRWFRGQSLTPQVHPSTARRLFGFDPRSYTTPGSAGVRGGVISPPRKGPNRTAQGNALGIDGDLYNFALKGRHRTCSPLAGESRRRRTRAVARLVTRAFPVGALQAQKRRGTRARKPARASDPLNTDFSSSQARPPECRLILRRGRMRPDRASAAIASASFIARYSGVRTAISGRRFTLLPRLRGQVSGVNPLSPRIYLPGNTTPSTVES